MKLEGVEFCLICNINPFAYKEMSQSIYGKFQGRDNSCTSGEAASAGIENSPRVTKGLTQFPKNGLAGVVK